MLAFLPPICFCLLLLRFRSVPFIKSWREAFVSAAVCWGLLVLLSTEILSLVHALTQSAVAGFWIAAAVVLAVFSRRCFNAQHFRIKPLNALEWTILGLTVSVLLGVGATAHFAPPNNWDSMTTHMTRVMHWIQNRTVENYPVPMIKHLNYPPWAAYAILHFQLLSGGDHWATGVQWFAMSGCAVAVSIIARELGAGRLGQLLASLLSVTIPMGILQGSSTQNDYVAAFWLSIFVFGVLKVLNEWRPGWAAVAGFSLGLAFLIKGTVYFYCIPFLVWLGIGAVQRRGFKGLGWPAVILIAALSLNVLFYMRSFALTNSLIPPSEQRYLVSDRFDPRHWASGLILNVALHLKLPCEPWNRSMEKLVYTVHGWTGDRLHALSDDNPFRMFHPFHEDHAGNFLHLMFFIAGVLLFCLKKEARDKPQVLSYLVCLMTAGLLLCVLFIWTMFHTRYHLGLFVLAAPWLAALGEKVVDRRLLAGTAIVFWICAWPWVIMNEARPMIGERNVFKTPRLVQYFNNQRGYVYSYVAAVETIAQSGCTDVGLTAFSDTWEYPLWVVASSSPNKIRFEHLHDENPSSGLPYPRGTFEPCALLHWDPKEPFVRVEDGKPFVKVREVPFFSVYLRFDRLPAEFQREFLQKMQEAQQAQP